MDFIKNYFTQGSTWKGLALLGSTAAALFGYGDLISVSVTDAGMQYGGLLGVAVPGLIGAVETVRNERKGG
jgi:hypothetical protein